MAEPHLRRLHVDPADDERGGVQPPQVMETVPREVEGIDPVQKNVAEGRPDQLVPYLVPVEGGPGMALTASEARKNLFPLIEQVNNDHEPVQITSKRGDAVLMSKDDYDALEETAYLLRVPANAAWVLESLEQARKGERQQHDLS